MFVYLLQRGVFSSYLVQELRHHLHEDGIYKSHVGSCGTSLATSM